MEKHCPSGFVTVRNRKIDGKVVVTRVPRAQKSVSLDDDDTVETD